MNYQLEVETDHGATKLTKSKINVDRRSSITEIFPVTNFKGFLLVKISYKTKVLAWPLNFA